MRVPLADGSFAYGRVLKLPHDAYYDYRTNTPDSDLERIASKPILFKIAVRHLEERAWELIGWRELEEQFSQPSVQFMQEREETGREISWLPPSSRLAERLDESTRLFT
ncbi:immunity 26/phosphotriesterase HocA family protein [Archangium lipolyticum]|uniref:immunity 26/phosphotriesterase HocA family protein n=1 Tax=Archangium lipolyticum TaxID=2970465 RepID=UPI00214A5D6E|nr:immunity 26/phosphotriesterase HocA family protein [Archangium lipolyticum]